MYSTFGQLAVTLAATTYDPGKILLGVLALATTALLIAFVVFSIKHMSKVDLKSFLVMFVMLIGVAWMVKEFNNAGDIGKSTLDSLNKSSKSVEK